MDSSDGKTRFPGNIVTVLRDVPGAALLFAVLPLLVLGYLGWFYYGAEHLDQALYSLQQENLAVTQQPNWIKSDVAEEVFRGAGLDRISLLDPNANATIAQAFEAHTWVRSTMRVAKAAGGTVDVDLIYRRPAAMVYCAPEVDPSQGEPTKKSGGFYAVDEDGIILPSSDFDKASVLEHFLILHPRQNPWVSFGKVGMSFGDARIAEALSLCVFLNPDRVALGLLEIRVNREPRSAGTSPWILTIVTDDDRKICWGHAPNIESPGEPSADEKHRRMVAWLGKTGRSRGRKIDLRIPISSRPVSTHGGKEPDAN